MAFDDVARRMAKRHDAPAPVMVDQRKPREWWKKEGADAPDTPEPVMAPQPDDYSVPESGFSAYLALWGGMVIILGSALFGVFTFGTRIYFKLALLGVGVGIAVMAWGARRD